MSRMTYQDVRAAYLNEGMSRREFARLLDMSSDVIRRLEEGRGITPSNAKKIADHFGLKVTDLMPLENEAA